MKTFQITIENDKYENLLIQMLNAINFISKVEPVVENTSNKKQFLKLKKILNPIEKDKLFKEISDPVEWQKNIRNEWE